MPGGTWQPPSWLEKGAASCSWPVPTRPLPYPAAFDHADWQRRCTAWAAQGRKDDTVLGPYASLASTEKRFVVLWRDQPGYGWPEARAVLAMQAEGFTCWTGVQLFPRDNRNVNSPMLRANTETVEALLRKTGRRLPRDYHARMPSECLPMRNPDLVCFNKATGEWRFIEVKWKDSVAKSQLNALAFLHHLLGGSVSILKVRPEGRASKQFPDELGAFRLTR